MKVYNPIDCLCLMALFVSKIFKKNKRFKKIYEKTASLIELRYLQTSFTKNDDNEENESSKKESK